MYLFIDIGGTKIRLAVSKDAKTFSNPNVFSTPEKFSDGIDKIIKQAKNLALSFDLIIVGVAGSLDKEKTKLLVSPNLPKWEGEHLKDELKKAFNCNVILENDSALVALGEAVYGAGKDKEIVAYLTISTGVGGARIVEKKIDKNRFGFEPGHQILDMKAELRLGDAISGAHMKKEHKKDPKDIFDEDVWRDYSKKLAYGVYNTILFWSPDVVVLGGSMMKNKNNNGILIDVVKNELALMMKIFPEYSEIKKAELGDFGGLFGAMALASKK